MSSSIFRQRAVARWLVAAALLIWSVFFCLTFQYQNSLPTVADEQSGRVYSLNEHGHIVYLTLGEQCGLFALIFAAVGCFVSGYVIDRKARNALAESSPNSPKA